MPKKYIIANWKMAPETLAQAEEILEFTNEHLQQLSEQPFTVTVCPPFIFIEEVSKLVGDRISLGAEDISPADSGALTGEISGPMLANLGVRYVIVGHSERRWKLGESDEAVNEKLKAVLRNGMIPVVCLGERQREGDWSGELRRQTNATFAGLTPDEISKCIVAYEPVWAISSNPGAKPDNPDSALESMKIISEELGVRTVMLYGGSITSANAREFLSRDGIDGVLVGGASVRKEEFVKILSQI